MSSFNNECLTISVILELRKMVIEKTKSFLSQFIFHVFQRTSKILTAQKMVSKKRML